MSGMTARRPRPVSNGEEPGTAVSLPGSSEAGPARGRYEPSERLREIP